MNQIRQGSDGRSDRSFRRATFVPLLLPSREEVRYKYVVVLVDDVKENVGRRPIIRNELIFLQSTYVRTVLLVRVLALPPLFVVGCLSVHLQVSEALLKLFEEPAVRRVVVR